MPGAPDTYTDENGKVQVYTLAKYLDDSDPGWRQKMSDYVFDRLKKMMMSDEDTDDRR
jgi:hypothetical protein